MRLVFDLETDGLLQEVSRLWILFAVDLDSEKKYVWLEGDLTWMDVMSNADVLIGHNIIGYDLQVLKKLFQWSPAEGTRIHDTLIMSRWQPAGPSRRDSLFMMALIMT